MAPSNAAPKGFDPTAELTRIRADVDFWAARLTAHPNDIVSAVKLAESDVAEARLTGDVTAYVRAEQAADAAIVAQPGYLPAQSMRASILVSLHRFPQARELARWILFRSPADSTALGVLGDASLELGDLTTAATAYSRLALVADGSAAQVRAARLAFVEGDPAAAVAGDRTAVASATQEGLEGDALGFYHVTLGETLLAAGDPAGARTAFEAAVAVRPDLPAALVGLAKLDAFDGRLSTAITELDTAIAAIPLPDTLARRADLLTLRGEPGDARKAQADRATVEAIAQLAGEAGSVYDRGLSLYLSDHGLEPDRAVRLARDELAIRPDVYGYDTLAWALLNAGDAAGADAPMQSALARRHEGRPAVVPRRAHRPRQRTSRRGRHRPPQRPRARAGPGPDVPRAGVRRPGDDPMRSPVRAALRGTVLALVFVPVVAAVALAHPLGNFTINHYAGIRVEPSRVVLDVVIDEAEIPTFQASQGFDLDGDGTLSPAETAAARASTCVSVGRALSLTVDGTAARLALIRAGLTFPPGNGGLSTMRSVCTYEAPLASPIVAGSTIEFADGFEASRIGWREMTVVGSGVTATGSGVEAASVTGRLTAYPTGLAGAPNVRSVSFKAAPGGPTLPALDVPDADPIGPIDVLTASAGSATVADQAPVGVPSTTAAPGSVPVASSAAASVVSSTTTVPSGESTIPEVLRSAPATPLIALIALLTAGVLGAGHAVTPGHGKTLMAAYLVGTRGTPRHAVGLGLAVSVSHTLGILGLAAVVLAAESTLPPDLVVRVAPLVAAISIVLVGGWMLLTEVRRGVAARRTAEHAHAADARPRPCRRPRARRRPRATDDGAAHDHGHQHPHPSVDAGLEHVADDGLEHAHGGVRHRHVPPAGSTISWRSLFVLGLAGGLVPSASALLILLATIAAGRPAWGVVLVASFGLGMAAVMTGVGLAFVHARGLLERAPTRIRATRAVRLVPAGAAALVLMVGVVLTTQALSVVGLV